MVSLSPVALTGNSQEISLKPSGGGLESWIAVRLANESQYALRVVIGGASHWLSAWTADVFPCHGDSQITVLPSLITSTVNAPSSVLLVSLAGPGEEFPGTYPVALTRQASAYLQQKYLGHFAGAVKVDSVVQLDPGAQALAVFTTVVAGAQTIVYGTQSNQTYVTTTLTGANLYVVPVVSGFDTQLHIVVNGTNTADVVEIFDVMALYAKQSSGEVYTVAFGSSTPGVVNLRQVGGVQVDLGQNFANASIPVVIASNQLAAPWQAARKYPTALNNAIAGGGTLNIIAGVAGQLINVHDVYLTFSVAPGAWNLSDSVTQYFADLGLTTGPYILRHSGSPLTVANPLRIQITTACTVRGMVTASQQ